MNITQNFLSTAKRTPGKIFLIDYRGNAFTYKDTLSLAQKFAAFLKSIGIRQGERIILTFPNCVEYIVAYIGTLLYNCTAIIVDYQSRPKHLEYVLADAKASVWISPEERLEYKDTPNYVMFPNNLESFTELSIDKLPNESNLALIIYTSGTTGSPKGVCLSHENLSHTLQSIIKWACVSNSEHELTTLSLTHLFGLAHFHVHWTLGNCISIEKRLDDIPRILQRIKDESITTIPGTPAGFRTILDHFSKDFKKYASGLRYIIINSAPMPEHYTSLLLELLPKTKLFMYYGLTEASRSTYICYNDHKDKLGTVGKATPGTQVCIGSPEHPVVDEQGEILVKGPHVTPGYFGLDSTKYITDGWFHTGDLGVIGHDGFLTWTGRLKEQINVDGLKLLPQEVEDALRGHPSVKDCAVVGVPDHQTGESVVGFVVVEGEVDPKLEINLRRFCKNVLELYKIPKRIYFVDEIPKTTSGKIKRLALVEKYLS